MSLYMMYAQVIFRTLRSRDGNRLCAVLHKGDLLLDFGVTSRRALSPVNTQDLFVGARVWAGHPEEPWVLPFEAWPCLITRVSSTPFEGSLVQWPSVDDPLMYQSRASSHWMNHPCISWHHDFDYSPEE